MKQSTVELEIPNDIFERAKDIANGGNRSIATVLREGLIMVFGATADSCETMESLEQFSDEQLWKIINHQLTWAQDSRWRKLMTLNKRGLLTEQENSELDDLADLIDRQVLMRSKALLLMKQRGHDIDSYLGYRT